MFKVGKPVADFSLKTVQVWGEADKPDADFSMFKAGRWFVAFSMFCRKRAVLENSANEVPTLVEFMNSTELDDRFADFISFSDEQ